MSYFPLQKIVFVCKLLICIDIEPFPNEDLVLFDNMYFSPHLMLCQRSYDYFEVNYLNSVPQQAEGCAGLEKDVDSSIFYRRN